MLIALSAVASAAASRRRSRSARAESPRCTSRVTAVPVRARCTVPLDRAEPGGRQLALAVQRVPASGPRARHDRAARRRPGPGGDSAVRADLIAPLSRLPPLRGFELVTFDQRGTGQSGGLRCKPHADTPGRPATALRDAMRRSARRCPRGLHEPGLRRRPRRRCVRRSVAGPLSLLAVSYGGRGSRVCTRTSTPKTWHTWCSTRPRRSTGPATRSASQRLRALPRVLDEGICGAAPAASFTANAYEDLTRLVGAAAAGADRARTSSTNTGAGDGSSITEAALLRLLCRIDLPAGLRRLVPAAIAAADDGNPAPLARLIGRGIQPGLETVGELSDGRCILRHLLQRERDAVVRRAPIRASRPATLDSWLGGLPRRPHRTVRAYARSPPPRRLRLCADWPATPPAPAPPAGSPRRRR